MSNFPTTITNPTPLIQNQAGTITYFVDISNNNTNTFPEPETIYSLLNSDGTILSAFSTSSNCEDIETSYQNKLKNPTGNTFDTNGYMYITDVCSNYITIYHPNFIQTLNYEFISLPIGINFNPSTSLFYVTNIGSVLFSFGSITALFPLFNSSLNPGGTDISYSNVIDGDGNFGSTSIPNSNYCFYPYDIAFDGSGNIFVANFGDSSVPGFISKLFIENGSGVSFNSSSVTDAAVIISSTNVVTSGDVTTANGDSVPGLQDTSLFYPSNIVYDVSNNYLYVSNVNASSGGHGQITMYSITSTSITLINHFNVGQVGNSIAYDSSITQGQPITSLTMDNYSNLYYIYYNGTNTFVNAIFPQPTGDTGSTQTLETIYSHNLVNIQLDSTGLNYVFGLSFYNGNIFVTGNVTSTTTSVLIIQNALSFYGVSLPSGDNQTLEIRNETTLNATLSATLSVSVPSSNTLISNATTYINQPTILTYYDNPNSANLLVPTGGFTYELVDSSSNEVASNTGSTSSNEIEYAPYFNELGSFDNPISMDFDGSGNLYVLNNPSTGNTFITLLMPNSGNFQISYFPINVTVSFPTAIRYNPNDNNMYITTMGIDFYGIIYKLTTTFVSNGAKTSIILEESIFYENEGSSESSTTYFGYLPIDVVFDASFMYVSCAGSGNNISGGPYTTDWNANITRFPVTYDSQKNATLGTPIILITQDSLSNYISGIAIDNDFLYVVNAPDSTQYSESSPTTFGNYNTNISQYSKTTGQLINRFNAGFVGKLPDDPSLNSNNFTNNIGSSLRFDSYGNLFYITYYDSNSYNQPYYLNESSNILYNTPVPSGSYYVQAFVPSSGLETPVYSHKIVTNVGEPVLGLAIFNQNIYVAQYNKNQVIEILNEISFGNFGYGADNSQLTLYPAQENNSYYILGGNGTIYNINIKASIFDYAFSGGVIITTPNPIIASCPGTLYYYNNPSTFTPTANTSFSLINSDGKNVANKYTSPPGNETTIIYKEVSSPKSITNDPDGYLYIANYGRAGYYQNGSIVKSTTSGQIIFIKQNINIQKPSGIKYNPNDGFIYYANGVPTITAGIENSSIYKMSTDGSTFSLVYQDQSYNYLYNPNDLCFDSSGNIYITNGSITTDSGTNVNGSVVKISMNYKTDPPSPTISQIFSNYLTGLSKDSDGVVVINGISIDTITNYLYVVTGSNTSQNTINISQIPLTGYDAGSVCKEWKTGAVGNGIGETTLNFDIFGNLYYCYYDSTDGTGYLRAFNPYTNSSSTYNHKLLGKAAPGAYGILYYNGNIYVSESVYDVESDTYIDNIVKVNASYYFTGVFLQAGRNVLSINTTITNQVVAANIIVNAVAPKYYTIPSQAVAGEPAKLIFEYAGVITPINGHNYVVVDSQMNYVSGILNYNSANEPNIYTFTFSNLVLPGGANYLYIFDITTGQIVKIQQCYTDNGYIFIKIPVICFYKGTKILCLINGKDTPVPIEKIGEGTLVKTYKRGYRKVKYNIMGKLNNTQEHSIDKLFKLSKKRFPELGLTEDLYITGSHALLHDSLSDSEVILMKKVIQMAATSFKSIYNAKIEDKYKLLAYHDERFEEIMMNAVFEIYHIVLENENENFNYGIYANGILAESTDEITLMRMKGFEKVNKTSVSLEKFINSVNSTKYPAQVKRALLR